MSTPTATHVPPPMHCTGYVEGDPAGCARCGERRDLHGVAAPEDVYRLAAWLRTCPEVAEGTGAIDLARRLLTENPPLTILSAADRSALVTLMEGCGQALYHDGKWVVLVYQEDGSVAGGNGVNSYEASMALDAVAQVLGMVGPSVVYDRLCESALTPGGEG